MREGDATARRAMGMKSYRIAKYKMPLVVAEQPRPAQKGISSQALSRSSAILEMTYLASNRSTGRPTTCLAGAALLFHPSQAADASFDLKARLAS
jgi:hypothetical protein